MRRLSLLTLIGLLVSASAGAEIYPTLGNRIEPLETGELLNAKRLELIENARKFVYVKTFIINEDPSEHPVYEALCRRARSGVDVRVLVDDMGRRQGGNPIAMSGGRYSIKWFRSCGVRFERHAPPGWGPVAFILYSQHDKLLVTEDGGIMGGTNFSRDYSAHAQLSPKWYDHDVFVEGPAACSLQQVFTMSWKRAFNKQISMIDWIPGKLFDRRIERRFSPETLHEECHAVAQPAGSEMVVIYNDPYYTPEERPMQRFFRNGITQVIESDVAAAGEKVIDLYAPYFVPSRKIHEKLLEAANKGVRVRILTNSATSVDPEAFAAYAAMLMRVNHLLAAGVEIHLWNPSSFPASGLKKDNVFHRKGGCFAQLACFVGSHNLDIRGDKYSSEMVAAFNDPELMRRQREAFENDLRFAVRMDEAMRRRLLKDSKITDKLVSQIAGWAL